jgi:LysM repeat protein
MTLLIAQIKELAMKIHRSILSVLIAAMLFSLSASPVGAAPVQSCIDYHVVQVGENLYRIALQYGMTFDVLMQANGILNPNLVYVGQSLCIPGGDGVNPIYPLPQPQPGPSTPPGPGCGTYYYVKFGDTLSAIAYKYGVSIYALMQANHLFNPNLIYIGMPLCVPGSVYKPPTTNYYSLWKGEYFNNAMLAGQPSLTRNDAAINFNWGTGWPTSKLSADNFSVRWTRSLYFLSGTFRFTAAADDGLRLYIDNVLVLDQWHTASGIAYTADVTLGSGYHTLRYEMYEATGNASASLTWVRVTSVVPEPGPTPVPPPSTSGNWTGYYFGTQYLTDLIFVRTDPQINFDWGNGSPGTDMPKDLFSVRWISTQYFADGLYQFNATVDDGVRIWVDGNLVVNEWFDHAGTIAKGTMNIAAGNHTIKVEYYEKGHQAKISVTWFKK